MILKISLRAKGGVPKTLLEQKHRLNFLYFPQNTLMLTESREEFSDLHSIFRLRALRYFAPVIPMSQEMCQRFQLVHPFTCMVAGITSSGKTVWVQSLLQQAQTVIDQPPERITWWYSQWQNAYTQ